MTGNGRVFISHAHADNARCAPLLDALRAWGVDVWFDTQQVEAGQDFADRIQRAMRERDVFVRVCTAASQRSYWVQLETNAFRGLVAEDHARGRGDTRVLINLILDAEYERQPFDYATVFIDATNAPQDIWLAQLRRALGVPEPAPLLPIVVTPPALAKPVPAAIRQAPPAIEVKPSARAPQAAPNAPQAPPTPKVAPAAVPNELALPTTTAHANNAPPQRAFTPMRRLRSNRLVAGVVALALVVLSGFALALAHGATGGSTAQHNPTATSILPTITPTPSATPFPTLTPSGVPLSNLPLPLTCADSTRNAVYKSVQLTGATTSPPNSGQNSLTLVFTVTCTSGQQSDCPGDVGGVIVESGDTNALDSSPHVTPPDDHGVFTVTTTFMLAVQQGANYTVTLPLHLSQQPATDCAFTTTSFVAPAPGGA